MATHLDISITALNRTKPPKISATLAPFRALMRKIRPPHADYDVSPRPLTARSFDAKSRS